MTDATGGITEFVTVAVHRSQQDFTLQRSGYHRGGAS